MLFLFTQEQANATWQSKYKKAAIELEEAEERGEAAEQALSKVRQRTRAASGMPSRGVSNHYSIKFFNPVAHLNKLNF